MRILLAYAAGLALFAAAPAFAKVERFPEGFKTQRIDTGGATLYVRIGGKGPAVVMLHGFGDTGDMWAPLAKEVMISPPLVMSTSPARMT